MMTILLSAPYALSLPIVQFLLYVLVIIVIIIAINILMGYLKIKGTGMETIVWLIIAVVVIFFLVNKFLM